MRTMFIFISLFFAANLAAAAPMSSPEAVGLSPEKLAIIDTEINAEIAAGKLSGATFSILRKGKLGYHKAFGTRGKDGSTGPLKVDDLFRIYSMTKPITTVALMQLMEQGKIKLSDPVSQYIPAFASAKVLSPEGLKAQENPITIADLLRHTSGVVYGFFGDTPTRTEYKKVDLTGTKQSTSEMVAKLASLPLEHQPGTTWEYSHSTDVVGHVIEIVSGRPLDEYLSAEIFTPLSMKDTAFYVPQSKKDRIVEPTFRGLSNPLVAPNYLSGGGGLMSTAEDYLIFCSMLLEGGTYNGQQILKSETISLMNQNQLGDIQPGNYNLLGKGYGFGYGFAVRLGEEGNIAGSKGDFWWGGYAGTYFWIDPAEDMIAVFMMQQPDQRAPLRPRIRNWVYNALVD